MNHTVAGCPNDHGPDGVIECWSPGGPCPDGRTVCEMCGECRYCMGAPQRTYEASAHETTERVKP